MLTPEQFYEKFIKPMPASAKLRLVTLIVHQLAADFSPIEITKVSRFPELDMEAYPDIGVYDYIYELPEKQKSSPKAVLQLVGTLSPEEADAILQAV